MVQCSKRLMDKGNFLALTVFLVFCFSILSFAETTDGSDHGETKKIITGAGEFDIQDHYLTISDENRPSEAELIQKMPESISVYLNNEGGLVSIPVTWFPIAEDYAIGQKYYYQFSPKWDEELYELSSDIDIYSEMPYIGVFVISNDADSIYAASVTGKSQETEVYNFLKNTLSLNNAECCGVLANIQCESSFNEHAQGIDTNGLTSYGLIQWNGSRYDTLRSWCSNNGYNYTTVNGQMHYLKHEMETSEAYYWAKVKGKENTSEGAYWTGYHWAQYFERCAEYYEGRAQWQERANLARDRYWPEYCGDATKPTIEDVYIKDIDKTGYTVHCIVRDETRLGRVEFPTWTENANASGNTQDDIIWGSAGAVGGYSYELNYRVNYSDHNNEMDCAYYTDIYCYDSAGNLKTYKTVVHYPHNGTEMTSGYDRVLPDGDYLIATAGSTDKTSFYYLDIEGSAVPAVEGTNVSLCGPSTDPQNYDIWTITYENGFYSIKQKGSNMALDVNNIDGNAVASGRNVLASEFHSGSNQLWAISNYNESAGYRLWAKCSSCCLDVAGARFSNGTNVQQCWGNDSLAQRWLFIPYKPSQPIDEGKYILLSGLGDQWELDVPGDTGDVGDGTNVTIWNDSASSRFNSFRLEKLSNGYYKVIHAASGKCLDVANGSTVSSGNVGLCQDNGSIAQQWAVRKNGNGYSLIARCSGYALDVWGNAADGTNVAQGYFHGGANQTWKFVRAEYSVKYDANGGSGAPAAQTKYYKADLTLQETEPIRDDYIFLGWAADDADAAEPDYRPGGIYELEKDVTMYAVWEAACEHQVSYTVEKEPTLTATGKLSGMCSVCGKTVEITLPVLNGTDYRYAVKTPSTCQKTGTAAYTWTAANGQTFVFEGQVDKIGHDYVAAQNPPTCIDNGSTTYTCSMCGDTYTEHIPVTEPTGDEGWTTEKPADVPEDMIFTRTQYRYRNLITTTDTASYKEGWTRTGSTVSYGDYGAWSGWSENAASGSDTRQVETRKEYRYYYFYCPVCGGHEPLQGTSDCHQYSLTLSDGVAGWFTTPYSDCNPQSYSYTTLKKWTTSLGDGQRWNLSTADIGHTDVGYQGDAGTPIIRLAYRYRDRIKTTIYSYKKWDDWSPWGDTEYTATSDRQVETRTVYKYDAERDDRHVWGKPEYAWDDTTGTLTAEYHCTQDASHEKTEIIENANVLRIPAGTKVIEEEAFAGIASQVVIIPEGCETIGTRAFADCPELLYVALPDSVKSIAEDAFEGSVKVSN